MSARAREFANLTAARLVARSVASAHGGDIHLENRPEGGLRATLTLPVEGIRPDNPVPPTRAAAASGFGHKPRRPATAPAPWPDYHDHPVHRETLPRFCQQLPGLIADRTLSKGYERRHAAPPRLARDNRASALIHGRRYRQAG